VAEFEHALKVTGMRVFNVYDYYWLADDGRVYSSAKQEIVNSTDPDYAAWFADGNVAKSWPRALDGSQTDKTLQEYLKPYNLFAGLRDYVGFKRRQREQGGMVSSAGFPVKTDAHSQTRIMGLYILQKENEEAATAFHDADGNVHQLDAAGMRQLATDLLEHINDGFTISASVLSRIGAHVIRNRKEVDAAFAAKEKDLKKG
jgi:hypothetical protein